MPRFPSDSAAHPLDYEFAQEKAATLGRLGRELERALERLREYDNGLSSGLSGLARAQRKALVAEAAIALWHLVVQREAIGLRDASRLMRDYDVPPEVRNSIGAFPPA